MSIVNKTQSKLLFYNWTSIINCVWQSKMNFQNVFGKIQALSSNKIEWKFPIEKSKSNTIERLMFDFRTKSNINRNLQENWFWLVCYLVCYCQLHRTPVEYKTSNINIKVYHISAHLLFGNRRSIVRFFSIDRLVQQFKMETLSSTFTFLPTEIVKFPLSTGNFPIKYHSLSTAKTRGNQTCHKEIWLNNKWQMMLYLIYRLG